MNSFAAQPLEYAPIKPLHPVQPLGGRIASLDGLRAMSILLVLVGHVRTTVPGFPFEIRRWLTAIPGNASLGVSIFFVISGFLITHLLLRETHKTGRISLRGFYLRRFFRIMPAYYAFLVCVILVRHFGGAATPVHPHNIVSAALFFTNYAPHPANFHPYPTDEWVGHTWSLSVEEQFYLFWPLLLSLIGQNRAKVVAVSLIVAAPVIRIFSWFALPHESMFWERMPFLLHTRVDALMFGCATALFYQSERFQAALRWVFDRQLHLLAFGFMFLVSPYLETWSEPSTKMLVPSEPYLVLGGYTLEGICIVLLIVWAVQNLEHPIVRLLNSRPMVHIGLISYSLYLWQQLFLLDPNKSWSGKFPVNLLCAWVAAEFSFFIIERPFLNLRDRFLGSHRYEKPVSRPIHGSHSPPQPSAGRITSEPGCSVKVA